MARVDHVKAYDGRLGDRRDHGRHRLADAEGDLWKARDVMAAAPPALQLPAGIAPTADKANAAAATPTSGPHGSSAASKAPRRSFSDCSA